MPGTLAWENVFPFFHEFAKVVIFHSYANDEPKEISVWRRAILALLALLTASRFPTPELSKRADIFVPSVTWPFMPTSLLLCFFAVRSGECSRLGPHASYSFRPWIPIRPCRDLSRESESEASTPKISPYPC